MNTALAGKTERRYNKIRRNLLQIGGAIRRLANACPQETPVILHSHLAARQKVRNRSDCLSAALRAGTDRQDQVTQ
jgi:hypothetical protein